MAASDSKLKQRIVGAIVLIALAVIFLPMLFKKEEPVQEIVVQAPPMPQAPAVPQFPVEEVSVPEPVLDDEWDEHIIVEQPEQPEQPEQLDSEPAAAVAPIAPPVEPVAQPSQPATQPAAPSKAITEKPAQQAPAPGIDKNNLPVSWSVQLANVTNKANAEALRDSYRKKQYNAYVRSADGSHRVLIGPLVKQSEAQAMCKNLKSRESQDCFVVRYQP